MSSSTAVSPMWYSLPMVPMISEMPGPLTSSSLAVSPMWDSLLMVPIISHNVNSNWRKKPSPQDYIGQLVHTSCYHNYIVICFPELQEGLLYIGLCLYRRLSVYKVSRMVKFRHSPVVQKTSCPSLYFSQRPQDVWYHAGTWYMNLTQDLTCRSMKETEWKQPCSITRSGWRSNWFFIGCTYWLVWLLRIQLYQLSFLSSAELRQLILEDTVGAVDAQFMKQPWHIPSKIRRVHFVKRVTPLL